MKYGNARHTEEFILRELYREFGINNNGTLNLDVLKSILFKINLTANDKYLIALISKFSPN